MALNGVDFEACPGQVTAIVGDNGAGKSTLIKIIAGSVRADSGDFELGGVPVKLGTPHAAAALGIATVYQDLALCENLDVVSNLFLGRESLAKPLIGPLRRLKEPEMYRAAAETLESLSVTLPSLRTPVAGLSGGQRQAVAVSRAVLWGSRLILMDEPTAALAVGPTAQVLALIRRLAERGLAVVVVSHSLPEVFSVAERIYVLRLGSNAGVFERSTTKPQDVVAAITGGNALMEGMIG
ncbi:MAG TPA: ATP-binding cassette domain-containing protein [Candidatus Dormibacteraeota bacterium]|jgi:D-xylose transport system ATP-binding protein|nr:ATP-binding cassette domain-containing protein [Candidatus Dormibacteraeota bacterium]